MEDVDPRREVETAGVHGMSFLFRKPDSNIFETSSVKNESLIHFCLEKCLMESTNLDGQLDILLSRTLKRIMTLVRDANKPLSQEVSLKIFDYVCKKWASSVDVICYECCDIFSLLLDVHTSNCNQCSSGLMCSFLDNLCQQLFSSPSTCRSRFRCIHNVVKNYPNLKQMDDDFVRCLYDHLQNPSLSVVISEIISNELSSGRSNQELHQTCLLKCVLSPISTLRSAAKDRLIPMIMKSPQNRDLVADLLNRVRIEENIDGDVQLDTSLSVTRILVNSWGSKTWSDFVSQEILGRAILHANSQVRLAAWSVLCNHPRTTMPYSPFDLSLMKAFLVTNAVEQSPAARQKILASFKQVLIRIAETSEQIIKRNPQDSELLEQYEDFIGFVVDFAFDSLCEGANFNRRVLALSLIDCIFRQNYLTPNKKTGFLNRLNLPSFLNQGRFLKLLACLDDSFQLCQTLSLDLLKSLQFEDEFDIEGFYKESLEIMTSIRSHNTLSSGYRFQFIVHRQPQRLTSVLSDFVQTCNRLVSIAEKDLMTITTSPVHPILNAIVSLVKAVKSFDRDRTFWSSFCVDELLPLCFRVAQLVTPVVHSMAPEGYIPEEKLSQLAGDGLTNSMQFHADVSQLLLACCWRAHKHVSELFDWSVCTLFPLGLLPASNIHRIGEYFWLQLTECRHCGAFESAVEGFTSLCSFLWKANDDSLPHPKEWLQRILKALSGGEDLDNLCSTRRSAGVPHLVVAIVATEPQKDGFALRTATTSLLKLENKEVKFRIHSLNVLKAMFQSSFLSERISFALEAACRVAVSGCSAASWSERNSSAQLAAALRTHIFGVTRSSQRDLVVDSKNRQSAHEFFSRFPSLYPFLFDQLEKVQDEFSLYPTLIFLTHLFPTSTTTKFLLSPFIPLCVRCLLRCRAEKLRKLCAAATVAISQREDIDFILSWIESISMHNLKQNDLHGILLLISSILQSFNESYTDRVTALLHKLRRAVFDSSCDYNQNILLQLCNNLRIDVNVEIIPSNCELTKRQIALQWLESGKIHSLEDPRLRLELYRWLDLQEVKLQLDDSPVSARSFFNSAIADLAGCVLESDAACVMRVLILYSNHITDNTNLKKIVSSKLDEEAWVMPPTIAAARKLLSIYGFNSLAEIIRWTESTYDQEDDYTKLQAIDVCCLAAKEHSPEIIKAVAFFLQDEDASIREQTARHLSSAVMVKFPLNPEVCRYLLHKNLQTTSLFKHKKDTGDEGLFDACAANVFAEPRFFGDYSVVEPFLH